MRVGLVGPQKSFEKKMFRFPWCVTNWVTLQFWRGKRIELEKFLELFFAPVDFAQPKTAPERKAIFLTLM